MEEPNFNKINKSSFRIPDNYFETIEDKIFERMNAEKIDPKIISIQKNSRSGNLIRKITIALTSAAACLAFFFYFNKNDSSQEFNLASIENSEIINYLNENADDVDLETLVNKDNETSNTFELLDKESIQIEQDELLDEINVEELF